MSWDGSQRLWADAALSWKRVLRTVVNVPDAPREHTWEPWCRGAERLPGPTEGDCIRPRGTEALPGPAEGGTCKSCRGVCDPGPRCRRRTR